MPSSNSDSLDGRIQLLVVEVETRLGLGRVGVLGRLRLERAKMLRRARDRSRTWTSTPYSQLGMLSIPIWWKRSLEIAGFVEQGAGGLEGLDGGVADDHLLAVALGGGLGVLLHRERSGSWLQYQAVPG